MYAVMETCTRFAVHVLSEEQVHLAKRFAEPGLTGPEQFEKVPHSTGEGGTPILKGVSSRLHCRLHDSTVAGNHELYVGLVVEIDDRPDHGAVLYYHSSYCRVGSELPSTELSPVKRLSNDSS